MNLKRMIRWLALTGLLSGLAACQDTGPAIEQPGQTSTRPVASETSSTVEASAIPTIESRSTGLTGQVIAASDVSGQPDEPLPDQMVLAVPVEKAAEILGVGADRLTPERLRFFKAGLSQADPAVAVTLSGADGRYTLLLDPGAYILCVADSEKTPPDFPAVTRGCGQAEVLPGELRQVDISSGFGEIILVEQR